MIRTYEKEMKGLIRDSLDIIYNGNFGSEKFDYTLSLPWLTQSWSQTYLTRLPTGDRRKCCIESRAPYRFTKWRVVEESGDSLKLGAWVH